MAQTLSSAVENKLAQVLQNAKLVDLTLTLDEAYPCVGAWLPPFRHVVYNWYEPQPNNHPPLLSRRYTQTDRYGKIVSGVYHANWMTIFEHTGTHFDAPVHCIPPSRSGLPYANKWGDVYGDMIPLRKFQGPAAVVDARSLRAGPQKPGLSPLITVEFLQAWEKQHGEFQRGDAIVLATGWDEFYVPNPEGSKYLMDPWQGNAPGWPAPNAEVIVYLADKGVELLATDAPTLGPADDIHSVHYTGLGRGMVFVECLAHLDQLPPRGSYFLFLPPKIARSSGCFGRAMAWVPSEPSEK